MASMVPVSSISQTASGYDNTRQTSKKWNFSTTQASIDTATRLVSCKPYDNKTSYTANDRINFTIPTGLASSFMDPSQTRLRFTLQANTTAAHVDYSANSIIHSISVFSGGQLLEYQSGVNVHECIENDLFMGNKVSQLSLIEGVNASAEDRVGYAVAAGAANAATYHPRFPSAIIGWKNPHMVPLALLSSSDLRVEIQLAGNDAVVQTGGTWAIGNVDLLVSVTQVSSSAMATILKKFGDEPVYNFYPVLHFTASVANEATTTINIPVKVARLNKLRTVFRDQANTTTAASKSCAARVAPANFQFMHYSMGGLQVPNEYPRNLETCLSQTLYAENIVFGPTDLMDGDFGNYSDTSANDNGWFVWSVDFETNPFSDELSIYDSDNVVTGIDTKALSTFLHVHRSASQGATTVNDTFALCTGVLYIKEGLWFAEM